MMSVVLVLVIRFLLWRIVRLDGFLGDDTALLDITLISSIHTSLSYTSLPIVQASFGTLLRIPLVSAYVSAKSIAIVSME